MNKNFILIGIIGILLILTLGCTSSPKPEVQEIESQIQHTEQTQEPEAVPEVVSPVLASAREWYSTAKQEAVRWRTDAKIVEILGNNKNGDEYLAADGKTNRWEYYFVSESAKEKYYIIIEEGDITEAKAIELMFSAKAIYGDIKSDTEWLIDSTSAIKTLNAEHGGDDILRDGGNVRIGYTLKFNDVNKKDPILWTVMYSPDAYRQNIIKYINAETGTIA